MRAYDRERKNPMTVKIYYGRPQDSESFLRWLGRLMTLGIYSVGCVVLLVALVGFCFKAGYDLGEWPIGILFPTAICLPATATLITWTVYVARYKYEGPLAHRKAMISVQAGPEEMKETLREIIPAFQEIGFYGFLNWLSWRKDNHSSVYYQALIDSQEFLENGPNPSAAALALSNEAVTRNINELNGLATRMFRVHFRYIIIVREMLLAVTMFLTLASAGVLFYWSVLYSRGELFPLW